MSQGYLLSTWLVTVNIHLDHLTEVVFIKFLHYIVTLSPPSHIVFLGWKFYTKPTLKVQRLILLLLRVEYLYKLEFSWVGVLSLLFHLLFAVFYWNWYVFLIIYFRLWVIPNTIFCCHTVSSLAFRSSLSWPPFSFAISWSSWVFWVCLYFLPLE